MIRDVHTDYLERLIWMIDNVSDSTELCAYPLACAFLKCRFNFLHKEIQTIFKMVLKNYSSSDVVVISDTVSSNVFKGNFSVNRTDFGVGTMEGMSKKVSNEIALEISVPVTKK